MCVSGKPPPAGAEEPAHFERRHSTVPQYEWLFATQTNSGPPPITIESARR